jgi:D-alanyl-lipoteichoic acid acyltransferase DltB (MBOAT superfamily)
MLFDTFTFFFFLALVFGLYWSLPKGATSWRNLLLLVASYIFYGWWDWRFLGLIAFSSVVDFLVGQRLNATEETRPRRLWLLLSLLTNLGLLGVFKYYDFFVTSFADALGSIGLEVHPATLGLILPVGISFYTFQTLSYTIDVYRRRIEPTGDLLHFLAFVSFFPQLVAGPIERASHLLPQFEEEKTFDAQTAHSGMRLILWGLFKKVVVADSCAVHVDAIFASHATMPPSVVALGIVYFAFQIYCDFSGYSDIAIGTGRLFGFDIMRNFRYPYFARDIAEFWRRWHISLSTWFRDYLYIPLGGSRGSLKRTVLNTTAVFVISGAWHGANWTFIIWGALNALYFIPLLVRGQNRRFLDETSAWLPTPRQALRISVTFALTCIAWVFFRADSVTQAFEILGHISTPDLLSIPNAHRSALPLVALLVSWEWVQRNSECPLHMPKLPVWSRVVVYYALIAAVVYFHSIRRQTQFIYFQF